MMERRGDWPGRGRNDGEKELYGRWPDRGRNE